MGLLDEIRKALESEKKSDFIDQILKEKGLHDALHDAGFTIVVDDPQARARQQPYGVLSTIQKIDLIDLIELINRIKLIDEITLISTIATVGSMTLLDRITQLDKIHPDPSQEQIINGHFEPDATGWTFGSANSSLSTDFAESATHSIHTYSDGIGFYQAINNILVDSVQSLTFRTRYAGYSGIATIYIIVKYSDATETNIQFDNLPVDPAIPDAFTERDITSQLSAGKVIVEIRFTSATNNDSYIDDVSLIAVGAHTVIDKIVSMPAITGSVSVTGSEAQLLLQRALTYDLIVQLRSAGVEIDPRAIRALTASDIVTVNNLLNPHPVSLTSIPNPPNLDVALSTRALESGGNLAAILAQLDSKTSTLFKATQNIGNTSFGATQATRTSLKVQPEREDIISLGGVASPSAAGVQVVPPSASLVPKVYDAEYEGLADGLHYFYFGTSSSPTTKRFLSRNTKGVNSKTFVQPRVGDAGDGIYLYSSVAETNMPYDLGYKLE